MQLRNLFYIWNNILIYILVPIEHLLRNGIRSNWRPLIKCFEPEENVSFKSCICCILPFTQTAPIYLKKNRVRIGRRNTLSFLPAKHFSYIKIFYQTSSDLLSSGVPTKEILNFLLDLYNILQELHLLIYISSLMVFNLNIWYTQLRKTMMVFLKFKHTKIFCSYTTLLHYWNPNYFSLLITYFTMLKHDAFCIVYQLFLRKMDKVPI